MFTQHNPDVISCLANLSSDEVFTPPNIAERMLDMLPKCIWNDENAKFLDPMCKSGIFLREITKRLMVGLEGKIKDRDERINHILTKQVFGIAVTNITSLITRRTVYCSKIANGEQSICSEFNDSFGNVFYKPYKHEWDKGFCVYCGASQSIYDRHENAESYAYNFIHPQINKESIYRIKYDVIIGGPPYQLYDGGGTGASARPVYQYFVESAKALMPKYIIMILPARWYSGGKGLDEFREKMLKDLRIKRLVDYVDSRDCFPSVDIAGGICYFLWDRDYKGVCEVTSINNNEESTSKRSLDEFNVFIRDNRTVNIIHKVIKKTNLFMDNVVSSRRPFGLGSDYKSGKIGEIRVRSSHGVGYIDELDLEQGYELVDKWKVFLSKASNDHGGQADKDGTRKVFARIEVAEPKTICTESYLVVGTFDGKVQAENMVEYLKTRFCRFLVASTLLTHNISKSRFCFVPDMPMNKRWSDEDLYRYFDLSDGDIGFIKSLIREM